jgi:hypothetical protein
MDDQRNDRHEEQEVNQSPRHVKGPPAQQPGHEEYDKQRHKHLITPILSNLQIPYDGAASDP